MPFKVQVGPPQIAIHQGQTVLVSEPDGQINWPSDKGLYFLDTRIVSNWAIYANGEPWGLLDGGPVNYYAARIFLTDKSIPTEDGTILPRTLGLTIGRSISGGLHEDLNGHDNESGNDAATVVTTHNPAHHCNFSLFRDIPTGARPNGTMSGCRARQRPSAFG
jgi:hypothetical protein